MNRKSLKLILVIFLLILFQKVEAQNSTNTLDNNLKFGLYLIDNQFKKDAFVYFQDLLKNNNISISFKDSLNNYLGRLYSAEKLIKESSYHFKSITKESAFFNEAQFQINFNYCYLGALDSANTFFTQFQPTDSLLQELYHFEFAGMALLQRDFEKYNNHAKYFKMGHYVLKQPEINLQNYKLDLENHRYKSSLVAGLLSSVLPGAGRAYIGKYGQGMISLMICSIVGLQAYEGYRKDGPQSFRFIAYTTAFSSLYIANIWGSSAAAQNVNNEFNEAINHSILVDMHTPVRAIFR